MFTRKYANERWYNFPSRLINVSALPCKTRKRRNYVFVGHNVYINWSKTRLSICTCHQFNYTHTPVLTALFPRLLG